MEIDSFRFARPLEKAAVIAVFVVPCRFRPGTGMARLPTAAAMKIVMVQRTVAPSKTVMVSTVAAGAALADQLIVRPVQMCRRPGPAAWTAEATVPVAGALVVVHPVLCCGEMTLPELSTVARISPRSPTANSNCVCVTLPLVYCTRQ